MKNKSLVGIIFLYKGKFSTNGMQEPIRMRQNVDDVTCD